MRIKFFLPWFGILSMTLIFTSTRAQDIDHVYLKNGSVIRGKILEIEPPDHVKIQDNCGNLWYYNLQDVEKITSEPFESGSPVSREELHFKAGYANITSIGFLAGSSKNEQVAPFSLVMVNGWRNSLGIFTGIGVGIEFLSINYLPLFADFRYDLVEGDVVPCILAKGGYSFPLVSGFEEYDVAYDYSGGALVALGAGLRIKSRTHFAWDISVMYRYQQTSYSEKYNWNGQEYDYSDVYNRIEIRLGFYID